MRHNAFQDFSSRLPITEPMPVVREEKDNQWEVNDVMAYLEGGDTSPLSPALQSEEEFVASIRSLIYEGKAVCFQAIPDLKAAAFNKRPLVRAAAIDQLGMLEEQAPIDILLKALDDSHWDVRAAAAQALGRVGNKAPIEELIEHLLSDEDESVQEALISTLGLQKERTPMDLLIHFLQDGENWMLRVAAAWALGRQGKRAPIRQLIHALSDNDELVREAVARVFGTLKRKDDEIEEALSQACDDPDEIVQEAANWALMQIAPSSPKILSTPKQVFTSSNSLESQISPDSSFQYNDDQNQHLQRNKTFALLTEFRRDKTRTSPNF